MNVENRTCRYCGYRFETEADRDAHIPCPEHTGDPVSQRLTPSDVRRMQNEAATQAEHQTTESSSTYGRWDVLPISEEIASLEGACPEHGDSLVWSTGCDSRTCRNYGGKGRDEYAR